MYHFLAESISHSDRIYITYKTGKNQMKAMSKQELACRAGVTVKTLRRWCRPYQEELERMGLRPHAKVLPPHIVKWMSERFCIDV
mgnify:CR=1 FL=1